jgi:signal transduction histidine kinase
LSYSPAEPTTGGLGEHQVQPGAGDSRADIDVVLAILSRPEDDDLADVVELVAKLCDAAAAGITISKDDQYYVPITYGIAPFVSASSDTFCQHTMDTEGVFQIEDAQRDPRFVDIGWVDGSIARARFYASAPLYAPDGVMVGRLCVIDPAAKTLTALQGRALETLAANVTRLIELRLLRATRPAPSSVESGQTAATVVSQLAAELSHDLRVPLASITASIEMLEDELEDRSPVVDALLTQTVRAAQRMGRMLEQSMEYGTGGEEPDVVEVDLALVAQQLVSNSTALLEAAGATVETADLPVVHADPDDMYSVLQNLLTNSIKFARPGVPPQVHVSARRLPEAWRISVRDNGVGIPEDRRVDVFSLFSRVADDVEGHGIGLATVARIISSHGGRAGVEPVVGGGTEIWFELPDDDADER